MSQHSKQLAELLDSMRANVRNFYAGLPENERVRSGTWETWAPKDLLAHMTFWQASTLRVLQELEQTPPELAPFEERNHRNFLATNQKPWEEINAAYHQSLDALLERLDALSDADLTKANHFPRLSSGTTLEFVILGNTYSHPASHLAELIRKYSGAAEALRWQEQATEKLIAFDSSPHNRGTAIYNLACAYALTDDVTRATELLREAFPLRPDLVEFSKQDSDFDKIRSAIEFEALYG